jgi:hypothetical protein
MLPVPTIDELADFTGRPVPSFSAYAATALAQATLMFSVATDLQQWPDDPDLAMVALYAVLELANKLVLEQPYQAIKASPFQSESIGSYNYSRSVSLARATAIGAAASEDIGAGLFWWVTAMDLFRQADVLLTASGSISVYEDGLVEGPDGQLRIENPVHLLQLDRPPYIRIS